MLDFLFAVDAVPLGSFTDDGGILLNNVWLIPTLPALSFVIILFFGKRMKYGGAEIGIAAVGLALLLAVLTNVSWFDHRDNFEGPAFSARTGLIETPEGIDQSLELGAGEPGTTIVVDGVEEQVELTVDAGDDGPTLFGSVAVLRGIDWLTNGGVAVSVGTLADGPSVIMLFVVTAISLLVHIYSTDYVHLSLIHI